jgi:apoptosis-inducing factor 2
MDPRTINPENEMVRVSRTMQILPLSEKATPINDDTHGRAMRSTSPTLCDSVPPSPVDTLVETDLTNSAPFLKPAADVSYDPDMPLYPHLFAIGDSADAFGAIKAGHTAYYQGEVAARNVIRLIKAHADTRCLRGSIFGTNNRKLEDTDETLELEEYTPSLPMIKVTLGLVSIFCAFSDQITEFLDRRNRHMKWLAS